MARNEEKQLGRLNRMLLQKEKEENLKKNPPRPKLSALSSADEIKKWLPSIVRDIDFNLKQSQVPCYTDQKVDEYRSNVDRLHKEYNAFVHKFKSFMRGTAGLEKVAIPWTERRYVRKNDLRKRCNQETDVTPGGKNRKYNDTAAGDLRSNNTDIVDTTTSSSTIEPESADTGKPSDMIDSRLDKFPEIKTNHKDSEMIKEKNLSFQRIETPILNTNGYEMCTEIPSNPDSLNVNLDLQDQPLTFNVNRTSVCHCHEMKLKNVSQNTLGLDYESSDSESTP